MMRSNIFATSEGLPDETTYPPRSLISSFTRLWQYPYATANYREGRIRPPSQVTERTSTSSVRHIIWPMYLLF